MQRLVITVFALTLAAYAGIGDSHVTRSDLDQLLDAPISNWRFRLGEAPGAEQPDYNDSLWDPVHVGHMWWPSDSTCWYRTVFLVPNEIHGLPVDGETIRLQLGVDNEAKAYVNGEFKQQFTWSDGDIVLTDRAAPGERIVIALHCINRPGSGSLYEANLTSSGSEPMVKPIRALLKQCDLAAGDLPYLPKKDTAHWRERIQAAYDALDLIAYHSADTNRFLDSVNDALAELHADDAGFEATLDSVANRLNNLMKRMEQLGDTDWRIPYLRADARVIESFLRYARDDMADGDPNHALRALKIAEYLDRISADARRRLNAVRKAPEAGAFPRYHTGPVSTRDGAFWQDGHLVYFTGVGHFSQVRKDTPILNDYGLNIIQIEMGPSNALPDPDTVDEDAIQKNIVHALDVAAEHNVAVNVLVSPHYFPQWALDKYPELGQCGHGFMKYCIDAPESRAIIEKWLRALMPLIKDHPALHSICLSNEPQYRGQCSYSKTMFADWLAREHGSIDKLNAIYGTAYTDWNEVPMPKDDSNYPLFFDWCRFNQDRFLEFHEFEKNIIHEYNPDLPVHAKAMSLAFRDPGAFEDGINFEKFNQLGAIAGNDCPQMFNQEPTGEFAQDWQQMAMNYTLEHSTAPDSPIFNSEDHIIVDGEWRYVPDGQITTAFWSQALHGQGAATTWVWERGQSGDLSENILTRPNCVRALGHVALDLNRLAPEMYALQRAPAEAAILYSYSSLLPSQDYVTEAQMAFEGGYFTGAIFDFVTETQVSQGKLADYKLVVVPHAAFAPEATVDTVQRYIRQGGTVLTVGPCFTHDEYARPRQDALRQEGSGRLVVYPDSLTNRAYREVLDGLLDDTKVTREAHIEGKYGEPLWGVNLRTVHYEGKILANLINYSRESRTVRLSTDEPVRDATDLIAGKPVHFPLVLKPLTPVLLELEPESQKGL